MLKSCFGWSFGSGCRADASEAAIILLPLNITVFTLDFSGSGISGGEHVTLGWNEVSSWLFYLRFKWKLRPVDKLLDKFCCAYSILKYFREGD